MPNRMGAGAWLAAVFLAASLAACSGGSSLSPAISPRASNGGGQTPTAQIRISVPRAGSSSVVRRPRFVSPATASVSITVNTNSQPTIANISPQAPGCTSGTSGITCVVPVTAIAGTDTFTITAYDQPNAQGHVLSIGTAIATIVAGTNNVNVTLNGVVSSIALALTQAILPTGSSSTSTLVVEAMDPQGNVIVGPGSYIDANGNPLAITVNDGDTSGTTTINGGTSAKVTSPSNASLTIHSSGSSSSGTTITFTAAATGITTASTTLGLAAPGSTLYVLDYNNSQINAYVPGSSGNVAPLRSILPTLAVAGELAYDSAGNIYVTDDNRNQNGVYEIRVNVYAPNASGNAAPIRQIAGPATGFSGIWGIAVDANGYVWVANYANSGTPAARLRADRAHRRSQNTRRAPQAIGTTPFIAAFAPWANGNVAPVGLIQGSTALVTAANGGMAFDTHGNLWVAGGSQVRAFSAAQLAAVLGNGIGNPYNQAPAITISGFSGNTYAIAFDSAGNMYANSGNTAVDVFAASSLPTPGPSPVTTSTPAPLRVLTGTEADGIAVDNSGTVYVGGYPSAAPSPAPSSAVINIYENNSTTPTRTILEPLPNYENCFDGNIGVSNGRIDITDDCAIALYSYPTTASGQATPSRIIQSPLVFPCGLWEDPSGYLYAASCGGATGGIAVFGPGASGYAQPARFIVENGTLDPSYQPNTVGVDASGNIYGLNCVSTSYQIPSVAVYTAAQNGLVSPSKTLSGTSTTLSGCLEAKPGFDPAGNLVIANEPQEAIDFFAPGPLGNVAPTHVISGASTTLSNPRALFVDAAGNVYVAQPAGSTTQILEFAAGQYGNIAPMRTVVASPLICCPDDMWVDGSGSIYVAEDSSGLAIFPSGSTGNYSTISGANTQISKATGVAVGL